MNWWWRRSVNVLCSTPSCDVHDWFEMRKLCEAMKCELRDASVYYNMVYHYPAIWMVWSIRDTRAFITTLDPKPNEWKILSFFYLAKNKNKNKIIIEICGYELHWANGHIIIQACSRRVRYYYYYYFRISSVQFDIVGTLNDIQIVWA